jgi:Asp-tRNA(Asn)/Glu-tRNA(Gln) amidotransferase A subunit family amidase
MSGAGLDATAVAAGVRAGELSAAGVAEEALERIAARDPAVNAFTCVLADEALEAARAVDRTVADGTDPGPLAGVPVSIKDVVWMRGAPATNGSRAHRHFVPGEDAVVVERLRAAGAILVGKTANPELCFAGATDSALHGLTRNPWDLERTPGGSSGGAGASVALGMTPLAIGSDGGGSIRIPASFCGIAGHKPSFGLVPSTPAFPGWPSLSVKGPLARTVRDLALCLSVVAGFHPSDAASVRRPAPDVLAAVRKPDVSGLRLAFSADMGFAPLEPGVRRCFETAIAALAAGGWQLDEAHPGTDDPTAIWNGIAMPEGHASHRALLEEHAHELEPRTAEILRAGAVAAHDDLDALAERAAFTARWLAFFERYDALLVPTMQLTAFPVGTPSPSRIGDHEVDTFLDDWCAFCLPVNLTGLPAASIPCGLDDAGLPVGLQVVGRGFEDDVVLRVAAAAEAVLPPIGAPPAPA